MKHILLRSAAVCLLVTAAPSGAAPAYRDHYAPGVLPAEALGQSVAVNGKYLIGGRPGYDGSRGDVVVFDVATGRLLRVLAPAADDRQAGDQFGFAVVLRGDEAIVSAPGDMTGVPSGSGSLYFFDLKTGRLRHKLAGSGGLARLGHALAVEGPRIVVGAPESANGGVERGAVLLVENAPGTSSFAVSELLISGPENNARLGQSVAIYGSIAAAGAPFMDNPGAADSGAVFIFDLNTVALMSLRVTAPTPVAGAHYGAKVGLTGDSLVSVSEIGGLVNMQSYAGEAKAATNMGSFISALAVSGRFIAVGMPGSGSVASNQGFVTVLEARPFGPGNLPIVHNLTPQLGLVNNERFGTSLALYGDLLASGAPGRFIEDTAGGGAIGSLITARGLEIPLQYNINAGGLREVVTGGDSAPNRNGATVRAPLEIAPGGSLTNEDTMAVLLGLTGAATSGGRGQLWAAEDRALRLVKQSQDANVSSGRISAFSSPVANTPNAFGVAVTLTGTGISAANRAAFLNYSSGGALGEVFRSGVVTPHGRVVSFQSPRQGDVAGLARYASVLRLASAPGLPVNAANDTIMRVVDSNGAELFFVREGTATGFGPALGQIGPWVSFEDRHAVFAAALAGSPGGLNLVKQNASSGAVVNVVRDGNSAAGIAGASFRTFPSAQINNFLEGEISFRATVKGAAPTVSSANNEGLWRNLGGSTVLILRKGSPPPGSPSLPRVKRILKHWVVTSSGATRALVQFSGPGVTSVNDLALIEVNSGGAMTTVLLREGDAAPGCASARIGTLLRVDANRREGFAVLLSLVSASGVASAGDNLAVYARPSVPSGLRQAGLLLRKGMLVDRAGAGLARLTSIAFSKNVNDRTGVTASGLSHAIGSHPSTVARPVTVGVIATWSNRAQSALSIQSP